MQKTKAWISAFRLRTLPLSLSSILMGSILAYKEQLFSLRIFVLAISTTLFLQILSNLANDYGDSKKGTDNKERIGPERAVQSGIISLKAMRNAIILFSILSFVSGICLVHFSLSDFDFFYSAIFILTGLSAIIAAIKYTIGKNPYGYAGFGDVFVFLFFGLVGVIGTYFLHTHSFNLFVLLPASSIGLLSASVLNMNNMRDIENDSKSNKKTLVVKIGIEKAKIYHTFLILISLVTLITYLMISNSAVLVYLCLLPTPIFILNLKKVWTFKDNTELDPELKKLALSTFLLTTLFGLGIFWGVIPI